MSQRKGIGRKGKAGLDKEREKGLKRSRLGYSRGRRGKGVRGN